MNPRQVDRLAPSLRPARPPAGTQSWQDLLFVHWEVDPAVLQPLLPAGLELDLWEGRALVGVVPFAMRNIRPSYLPHAFAFNFLEANVRTYVLSPRGEPGVYFLTLEASSLLAVAAARATFGLPYHYARMSMTGQPDRTWRYVSRRPGRQTAALEVQYRAVGDAAPSVAGTLQHFLVERYLLFVSRGQRLRRGQVHHAPYPVQNVQLSHIHAQELLAAVGLPHLANPPVCVHASPGVNVEVFALELA